MESSVAVGIVDHWHDDRRKQHGKGDVPVAVVVSAKRYQGPNPRYLAWGTAFRLT
jgi:hypothetical protein